MNSAYENKWNLHIDKVRYSRPAYSFHVTEASLSHMMIRDTVDHRLMVNMKQSLGAHMGDTIMTYSRKPLTRGAKFRRLALFKTENKSTA